MNRSLLIRGLVIAALAALAAFSAWPLDESINLGLDLRGGMHLVLQVETADAVRSELTKDMDRLVRLAEDDGITGLTARTLGVAVEAPEGAAAEGEGRRDDEEVPAAEVGFVIGGVPADQLDAVVELAREQLRAADGGQAYEVARRGGGEIAFRMNDANVRDLERLAVRQARDTIGNRIDAYGVAEPVIQPITGTDRIVVQLPGVDDPERVRDLIKRTAFLEFRLTDFPRAGGSGAASREAVLGNYGGSLPEGIELIESTEREGQGDGQTGWFGVESRPVITGRDLKSARPGAGEFNEPVVLFSLTPEGGRLFGEATGANVGRGLAIVLDGRVVSAPVLESRITDEGQIRGSFTPQEVEDLSMVLRSGALPAGITYLEERTVGPSLGRDSIRQGLRAGLIGLGLVILAMLIVYRLSGINAVVALLLDMVLVFGALAYFGATLTLPGIAGIVLTIGMAVDANVLVFERIKEELRHGRTVRSAIDAGFAKALSSILDANVTTLIAALFLFQFGTGPIRGFAVTLSIGIFASVFTALFVSRWIFDIQLASRDRIERLSI
jgi:preprotein translocase subunit SecD